jgi:uncharacterized membrane protein
MKITVTDEELAGTRSARRGIQPLKSGQGVKFQKTITINLPVAEVYAFWSQLENLPRFMTHLQSVTEKSPRLSHWVVKPQDKTTLEWDAEILENRPNELISWQSLPGADVDNAGSVWFRPAIGNRGAVVKVAIKYNPPGGKFAASVAKLLGNDPNGVIEDDLFRLKSLLETGEIPTTVGQSRGNL